jgi:hypothetical protein
LGTKKIEKVQFSLISVGFHGILSFFGVAVSQFDVQTQQLFLEIFDKHLLARH